MKQLVERGMEAGAWGLSTGLIYVPGRYAETAELIELAGSSRGTAAFTPRTSATKGPGCSSRSTRRSAIGKGAGAPGAHLAPEGQRQGDTGARSDPAWRGSPRRGRRGRRHGRPVSLHRLEHQAGGDGRPALGDQQERPRTSPGWPPTRRRAPSSAREIEQALDARDGGASIRIARYAPRPEWAGLDLVTIAASERNDAARGRPGNPAARRRAGDQLRHERGRRPRGHAP